MDIDDLKELKKWVSDVNALDDKRLIVCISLYDDVQYLLRVFACFIDEAIARQSVKSEDVAEAIEQMEDALSPRYLESDGEWTGYNEFSTSAIRTAITALQAYEPTTRKNRTVEEVQEAIEWLKGMERSYNLDRATGFASSKHDEAAEHCRVLLTALQAYQPWVSVSERLPETGNHCQNHRKENENG